MSSSKELTKALKKAKAGDTIWVKSGKYVGKDPNKSLSFELSQDHKGTGDKPITVWINDDVKFTNVLFTLAGDHARLVGGEWKNSQVTITGDHNRVTKLRFYDGQPGGNHSQLSSAVETTGSASYNRIDHNEVKDWQRWSLRTIETQHKPTGNRFDHNYLHDLLLAKGTKSHNAGEAFQFGAGRSDLKNTEGIMTTVEYNLVDKHDLDTEVVSLKTKGVTIQYNTFLNAPGGALDTRHSVDSAFIGNYLENIERIEIFADNNVVSGNYLDKSEITVMSGNATFDELPKREGAHPAAQNTVVIGNIIKDGSIVLGPYRTGKDTREHPEWKRVAATNTCLWNNQPSKTKIAKKDEKYVKKTTNLHNKKLSHDELKKTCVGNAPIVEAPKKPLTAQDVGPDAPDKFCKVAQNQ